MAAEKKAPAAEAPPVSAFFRYTDESGRRVTIAGAAIVEVIENPDYHAVNVNFGDGIPDEFEGEVADKFLKWWNEFAR
jgi:hypothetical protein